MNSASRQLDSEWCKIEQQITAQEVKHRDPNIEYAFYNAVKTGDMDYVNRNCASDAFADMTGAGILSHDELTNLKYHFVVTAAMITRHCIDAGMEPELAYRLSDFYILKMDGCRTTRQVSDLHHAMARDFTGKMALQIRRSVISKPVLQCVDYIYSHINERVTIQTLADYTGLSPGYLSRVFKQSIGLAVSDYIREKKLEKAAQLLRYTDEPVADIANYLSFSSQSHFIQVFESNIGLTPKKYRDNYYASLK